MKRLMVLIALSLTGPVLMEAQSSAPVTARAGINAGNQAWIDGVKTGNIDMIIATYAEDAVDCGPAGDCFRGRAQIEQHMKTGLAALGRAHKASVQSWGMTERGNFAYEWGQAEATYDGEKHLVDKYLTVWQRQSDGSWKIFRNMVIPEK